MRTVRKIVTFGSEEWTEIVKKLLQGMEPREIAPLHNLRRSQVLAIQRHLSRRIEQIKMEGITQHLAEFTLPKAILAIDRGLDNEDSYKAAKVGVAVAKGVGTFKVGDAASPIGTQNNFYLTEQQAERLFELEHRARTSRLLPAADSAAIDRGKTIDIVPDHLGCAVVAEERDENL